MHITLVLIQLVVTVVLAIITVVTTPVTGTFPFRRKKRKEKTTPFGVNEKPSIIPGCPGSALYAPNTCPQCRRTLCCP